MQGRRLNAFLAPLAAGIGAALLCLSASGDAAGMRIYDELLRLRPAKAFPREILLVEAEESTGAGEWDGESLAEGIAALADLGAGLVVFPVPGSLGSDAGSGARLAGSVDEELSAIGANVGELFDAIRFGSVPPKDSPRYVAELLQTIDASRERLLQAAAGSGAAERRRLAGALRLLGSAYVAVDPLSDGAAGPALPVDGAWGSGFAPAIADADGSRRRLALLSSRLENGFEHPAFAALIDMLGKPALSVEGDLAAGGDRIVLRSASRSAGGGDIVVPLSRRGLLIEWPRPNSGAPRRMSWSELGRAGALGAELDQAVDGMGAAGLLRAEGGVLPSLRDHAAELGEEALAGEVELAAWREAHERYFERTALFLRGEAESELLAETSAQIENAASPEERQGIEFRARDIAASFAGARETLAELERLRGRLKRELAGSFCIVAPARAAAGLRLNPWGEDASEGLASAAAMGSILSERFLRELPPIGGAALGSFLALAVAVASAWLGRRFAAIEGMALALAAAGAAACVFVFSGNYLSPLAPALGPAVAALASLFVPRGEGAAISSRPPVSAPPPSRAP
jgi:hypothetical protein